MSAEAGIISRETAAKLLLITPRHLARLVADGWIKKTSDDKYTVVSCVQGYVAYLKDETRRNSKSAAASHLDQMRAREVELRIAAREKELLPLDEVVASMDIIAVTFRQALDGFPARFTRDPELKARLRTATDEVLNTVADTLEAQAKKLAPGPTATGAKPRR